MGSAEILHDLSIAIACVCAVWVWRDANRIGVEKGQIRGLGDLGPVGWFFSCLLLGIIAFPLYLSKRGEYLRINSIDPYLPNVVNTIALAAYAGQLVLVGILLFGHPKLSTNDLQAKVQESIVETFAKSPRLAGIHVVALRLVHTSGNEYWGTLHLSTSNEADDEVRVIVTYDGRRFAWRTQR